MWWNKILPKLNYTRLMFWAWYVPHWAYFNHMDLLCRPIWRTHDAQQLPCPIEWNTRLCIWSFELGREICKCARVALSWMVGQNFFDKPPFLSYSMFPTWIPSLTTWFIFNFKSTQHFNRTFYDFQLLIVLFYVKYVTKMGSRLSVSSTCKVVLMVK